MNPESPEIQKQKQEILESESSFIPSTQEVSMEDTAQIEIEKVEREKQRLERITELKQELGIPTDVKQEESPNEIDVESKKENLEKEDVEHISASMKKLSNGLDELSDTIARNGLPKVRFESGQLIKVSMAEHIDQKNISMELENLASRISKIRMPEDRRDMMSLEPHNIRKVMDGMENVEGDLLKLKRVFEDAQSEDYAELAQLTNKALNRLRKNSDGFHDAVSALQRFKGR